MHIQRRLMYSYTSQQVYTHFRIWLVIVVLLLDDLEKENITQSTFVTLEIYHFLIILIILLTVM